jgi:hypothetical protein
MTRYRTKPSYVVAILGISLGFVLYTVPAYAGGGNVLPPTAQPKGHSLSDIAEATAIFNASGFNTRSKATEPPVPFQILYTSATNPSNTFFVQPGTMLYVPIVFADDSPPIFGDFPTDVTDQDAVADYFFDQEQLGAVFLEVVVDGKVTSVGPDYVVGVETPPLPDGGGTHYIPSAVFLTPLTKGTHTVQIRGLLTGDALGDAMFEIDITYTVVVR